MGTGAGKDWVLWRVRPSPTIELTSSPLLDAWDDLDERERALGIFAGQPFLLRADGSADRDVLGYLNSSSFRRLALQSQISYAADLRVHLSFLEMKSVDWRDATVDDFLDYEYWRRRDARNGHRVSGAKFARELAACRRFYDWQVSRGVMNKSPVEVGDVRRRDGSLSEAAQLRPTNVRSTRVKWLTPRAYRRWRDVGLCGYSGDGTRDLSWRGRNDGRNASLADLLWSSGLRLREGSTLFECELPLASPGERFVRGRIGSAVAKGAGRDFWVSSRALRAVESYRQTTRHGAIERAHAQGRYDDLRDLLVVSALTRRRELVLESDGARVPLDALDAEDRRRVFVRVDGRLEPAMLWLTESGMPMPYQTWEMVFATANQRCAAQGVPIHCHPHMLRHSFALRMLVTLVHAFDRRLGLSAEERRDYRLMFGDPWVLVQTMLGHRSLDTTKSTYLEPVNGLQLDLFLNGEDDDDAPVSALLSRIAATSPRVNDGGWS